MKILTTKSLELISKENEFASIWKANGSVLFVSEQSGYFCYGFVNADQAQIEGIMDVDLFLQTGKIVYTPFNCRQIVMRHLLRGTGL